MSRLTCFTQGKDEKIKYLHLEKAVNNEDYQWLFVELKSYGLNGVYTLVDLNEFRDFYKTAQEMDICEISLCNILKDCPVYEKDMVYRDINIKDISYETWISMFQLKDLLEGVSTINENEHIGDSRYFDIVLKNHANTSGIKFMHNKFSIKDTISKFKYILMMDDQKLVLSNDVPMGSNVEGVFIKIPEMKCYQYVRKYMLKRLRSIDNITIQYIKMNTLRNPSVVEYYDEFYLDSVDRIATYGIYLPSDVYFAKLLQDREDESLKINKLECEGYQIDVRVGDYNISTTISQKEMILDFDKMDKYNQFWFLELINKVIDLKPY